MDPGGSQDLGKARGELSIIPAGIMIQNAPKRAASGYEHRECWTSAENELKQSGGEAESLGFSMIFMWQTW